MGRGRPSWDNRFIFTFIAFGFRHSGKRREEYTIGCARRKGRWCGSRKDRGGREGASDSLCRISDLLGVTLDLDSDLDRIVSTDFAVEAVPTLLDANMCMIKLDGVQEAIKKRKEDSMW